jgi:hypothetical protein
MKTLDWNNLTDDKPPNLKLGTNITISLTMDENSFLAGKDGIVWATYDLRQVEIIHDTLLAQQIGSEIKKIELGSKNILLIKISNLKDVKEAIDFIWRNDSGLRLSPDWNYPDDETNKSFEQWLNGQ